jgi:crotonobetaine/carnitine-CoA ligase
MHHIEFRSPEERVIARLLEEQAKANPDAIWLMMDDTSCTFGEAQAIVERLAGGFQEIGIRRGETVALMLENSMEHVWTVLALATIGAVGIPINTAYKGYFLRSILETSQPVAVVVESELAEIMLTAMADLPIKTVIYRGRYGMSLAPRSESLEALCSGDRIVTPVALSYRDPVSIMYTGGTTGRSKGVIQTNVTWIAGSEMSAGGRDLREDDRFYSVTPMFHSGAWVIVLYPSLLYGLPVGLETRFSVKAFWPRVKQYGATQLFTLGAMHLWLWAEPATSEDSHSGARVWLAVPLPVDLWETFPQRFGVKVCSAYGQTEIMPFSIADINRPCKPGSAGMVRSDMEARIVDDHDVPVDTGEPGELIVRPNEPDVLFGGYHRMPSETLQASRNLWYHSGDLCRIDADGELFFVDRKADYLRRRGENISSIEVEDVVRQHPDISGVAVHSVPADESEDEMKLCVTLVEGSRLTPLEIAEFCDANLPYFAVPRYIEVVSELPITPVGRVQKFVLRERGITGTTWDAVAAGFIASRHDGRQRAE